jgi:hypothetical protein
MTVQGDYLETARDVYRQAALEPQQGLCCTTNPVWQLPGLTIPKKMLAMNYGCAARASARPRWCSVGVCRCRRRLAVLQFAYFSRLGGVGLVDGMHQYRQ